MRGGIYIQGLILEWKFVYTVRRKKKTHRVGCGVGLLFETLRGAARTHSL